VGVVDVSFLSVEIRMDPGILLAVTRLDHSMGGVPVAVSVMPQACERATDAVGHRFVVEAGAEGFEKAFSHVRVKCLPMDGGLKYLSIAGRG